MTAHNEPDPDGGLTKPLMKASLIEPAPPLLQLKPTADGLATAVGEARCILSLASPMALTGLLLYSRSLVSMLFLGSLGRLPLAGGVLALGFANITGYSVLSGLALGIEPLCGQAFGARRPALLGPALHRAVLLLLAASLPIAALWSSMRRLLVFCHQDPDIAAAAHAFVLASLPDLPLQSLLHPLRVFLRAQCITLPFTYSAAVAAILHLPINYLFVSHLRLGIRGVALASVFSNLNLLLCLLGYIYFSGVHRSTGALRFTADSLREWKSLLNLAIPSCIAVCLEWWWYEIMILLCGLLPDPKSTVAAMGILIQTTSFIYIFPSSLSSGISTRVGNELGAGRPARARRAAAVGLSMGAALGALALAFAIAVRRTWARAFTADTTVAALAAVVMPVVGMCELGNCPQTAGCGVLRGSARPGSAANINLGAFYGVGMPVAAGLAFWSRMGFAGLWLGMLAAQATCVVLMTAVVRRTDWEVQAKRAQRLTGEQPEAGADAIVVVVVSDELEEKLKVRKVAEADGGKYDSCALGTNCGESPDRS